jgi:hypothetical protein
VIGSQGGPVQIVRCYLSSQTNAEARANRGGAHGSEWEDAGLKCWQELDGFTPPATTCCSTSASGRAAITPSAAGATPTAASAVWSITGCGRTATTPANPDKTGDTSSVIVSGGGQLSTIQGAKWAKFDGTTAVANNWANATEGASLTFPTAPTLSLSSAGAGQITISFTNGTNTNFVESRYRKRGTSRWSRWATTTSGTVVSGLDSSATYEVQARGVNTGQGGGVTGPKASGTQAATSGGADTTAPTITSASSLSLSGGTRSPTR